jgi:hypothetical protein
VTLEAPAEPPSRARRAKAPAAAAQPEAFVPLDLPGSGSPASDDAPPPADERADDDLVAAFPGLANGSSREITAEEDEEIARQLATLSPRAASAIRAAVEATTDEERSAALDGVDGEDEPLNRGLLLKFLSSVKS